VAAETIPLDADDAATFDASGAATVTLGPRRSRQTWYVTNAAVSSTSSASTKCRLYLGSASPSNLLGGTYSGNQDSTDLPRVRVGRGQVLTAVWSGGTTGAKATLSVYGEIALGE
jgi:hypothetical protein